MGKRQPKFDGVIDGVRVRVYATRSEHLVAFGTDDVDDTDAYVLCYPKVGTPDTWARQARAEFNEDEWRRGRREGELT